MKINAERSTRTWNVEVDDKDYRIVYSSTMHAAYKHHSFHGNVDEPAKFYRTLDIYSRIGIHAGAKQLPEDSPVYKRVQRAWLEHVGGWPS